MVQDVLLCLDTTKQMQQWLVMMEKYMLEVTAKIPVPITAIPILLRSRLVKICFLAFILVLLDLFR